MDATSERVGVPEQREVDAGLGDRAREWLLLTGDREVVAAVILAAVLGLVAGLLWIDLLAVTAEGPITRGLAALIGGNMTLITIAISVNQLVVSQEFGTPDELEDRIDEMIEYRDEAASIAGTAVAPVSPDAFLGYLVDAVRDRATRLGTEVGRADGVDPALAGTVDEFAGTVVDQSDRIARTLEAPPTRAVSTLRAILAVDFTGDLQTARWLQATRGDDLPAAATDALSDLARLFELIGVLRQYQETLYLQRELTLLSLRLFAVGVPAVVLATVTIAVYGVPAGPTVEGAALEALVAAVITISLSPLALFCAYVLRIATIARRTAALMPFRTGGQQ